MPRKKDTVAPPVKVSANLGNHLLEPKPITSPVMVVEDIPVDSDFKYVAPDTIDVVDTPVDNIDSMTEDPDYALYYYNKGPKNYSAASAWFAAAFSFLAIAGVGVLVLIYFMLIESNLKFEPPYSLLTVAWLAFLGWVAIASIGCGVYGLFTAKEDGYSRKPAVWGIVITLLSAGVSILPMFLLW